MNAPFKIFPLVIFSLLSVCCSKQIKNSADEFDDASLSKIWSKEKFLPRAISIQSQIVKSGTGAVQIVLHKGDQIEGEKGSTVERAELLESPDLKSEEEILYAYSFSIFLPKDFPIVPTRLVIAQWKQKCEYDACQDDSPVIAIRYQSGKFFITLQTDSTKKILYETRDEIRNKWLSFKFQIQFSRTHGILDVVLNGYPIIHYKGITCYSEAQGYPDQGKFYFKMGLYRDRMEDTMVLYVDEYEKKTMNE